MNYQSVVSAVVRALASEVINSAGGCDFEPKVQAARIPGAISGKEDAFLCDCWVHARLSTHLEPHHWTALTAKYSTHTERKHAAIIELTRSMKSPAPERFRNAAILTWAMPKLPGKDGKRSVAVLPDAWYDVNRWDDDGKPESTLYRWRSSIRRCLENQVNDALVAAQEILDAEGLILAA